MADLVRSYGCERNDGWPSEQGWHRGRSVVYLVRGGPPTMNGKAIDVCQTCARRIRLDWDAYLKPVTV